MMTRDGATIVPVPMDIAALGPLLQLPLSAEAYVFHQPTLDAHPELYPPDLRHRLMAAQYVLAQDYIRALRVRRLVMEAVRSALEGVDVLATPTMPVLPLRISDAPADPIAPEAAALLRNTSVINQSGHPAVNLPMALAAEGVPMGFQLVGQAYDDHGLLAVAEAVERLIGFARPAAREGRTGVTIGDSLGIGLSSSSFVVPESHLDLLTRPLLAHLGTVRPDGAPQVNPMWFFWDGTSGRGVLRRARQALLHGRCVAAVGRFGPRGDVGSPGDGVLPLVDRGGQLVHLRARAWRRNRSAQLRATASAPAPPC